MWLLVWAVILNTLFMQVFKKAERTLVPTARFYVPYGLFATALALAYAVFAGDARPQPGAIIAGLVFGICLYASLRFLFKAQSGARIGMVWTIQALNILIPIGVSLLLWGERCAPLQAVGLLFVLAGAAGVAWGRKPDAATAARDTPSGILFAVLGSLASGIAGVCWKYMGVAGLGDQIGWFICIAFAVVLAANAITALRLGWPRPTEWLWGGILGGIHSCGTVLAVFAVGAIAAAVAFPILVGGPLVLTVAAGYFIWKESFSRLELAALGCCVAGIICLTVK